MCLEVWSMVSPLGCRMDVSKQPMKAASTTEGQVSCLHSAEGAPALHLVVLLTDIMLAGCSEHGATCCNSTCCWQAAKDSFKCWSSSSGEAT